MSNKPKIIFIGTSEFAVPILNKLISHYRVPFIITAPNKPVPCTIKQLTPKKIIQAKQALLKAKPDLIVLAAYGQIIPKSILKIPKFGVLNIHPSLLPKYRGPSPIQTAILNGDKQTGVSIILMDEKIDHGPIIAQERTDTSSDETKTTLEEKLSKKAANLLIKIIPDYLENKIKPKIQNEQKATYTKILARQDGKINWKKNAQSIERKIRAFSPWPGAWTHIKGKRIKILKAKAIAQKEKIAFPTGKGFLKLEMVQPESKKPMTGAEFFRGYLP